MFTHSTITNIKSLLDNKEVYGFSDKTYSRTGMTTSGSATITVIDISDLQIGDTVSGTGIQEGSTILSIGTATITLDKNCTATSVTAVDITVRYYASTAFDAAIAAVYDDAKLLNMLTLMDSGTYDAIDATVTASLTTQQKFVVKAEQYYIAARFLETVYNKEYGSRMSMREFRVENGLGVSTGGIAGKNKLANDYRCTASNLMHKAGYTKLRYNNFTGAYVDGIKVFG